MIEEAQSLALSSDIAANVSFMVADCSTPTAYPGGQFDIVFGAWFLNYAPDKSGLVDMYRNIFLNLKPGGCFVAVTPPPTNNPSNHYEKECRIRPLPAASGGLFATTWTDVEDGIYFHLHSDTPAGDLDFDTYHLRKDIWEAAAREAGFQGELEWSTTDVPQDFMADPSKYGEESNGRADSEELATYAEVPHYGLLFMRK